MSDLIEQNYYGVSPADFAHEVLERMEEHHGVRLLDVVYNDALTTAQKRRLLVTRLVEKAWAEIDRHNAGAGIEAPPTELENQLRARFQAAPEAMAAEVEVEPNLLYSENNANVLRGMQGQDLHDYVFSLTKRFENMALAKTEGHLAREMAVGGLVAVGVPMAVETIKALRGGATVLAAMKAGITNLGLKTAVAFVAVILVSLLLFLFIDNPKKVLGIVVNDTDSSLVVNDWRMGLSGDTGADLFMQHGQMESFPEDHETGDLNSPKVQIKARYFFAPADVDNSVFAGVYFADRKVGFLGTEGIMVFEGKGTDLVVAHQFAVPYTDDNGTNIRALASRPDPSTLPDLYAELSSSRKVRVDTTDRGYALTSTMNDARGGVVALIASIKQP